MPIISGRSACELSAAGLGLAFGAISGGATTGGTLAVPASLAGAAYGYLLGKAVCRIPALQKAFDRALGTDDWNALDEAFADASVRAQAVALIQDEAGLSHARAEQVWDALILTTKRDPQAMIGQPSFEAARYHPPTGTAKHGIADLLTRSENCA